MNNILTYNPKNQGLAFFIFALVAIVFGGTLYGWMGKLSILYVALSFVLLVLGVGVIKRNTNRNNIDYKNSESFYLKTRC